MHPSMLCEYVLVKEREPLSKEGSRQWIRNRTFRPWRPSSAAKDWKDLMAEASCFWFIVCYLRSLFKSSLSFNFIIISSTHTFPHLTPHTSHSSPLPTPHSLSSFRSNEPLSRYWVYTSQLSKFASIVCVQMFGRHVLVGLFVCLLLV